MSEDTHIGNYQRVFLINYTLSIFCLGALLALNSILVAKENPLAFVCWQISIFVAALLLFAIADKFLVVKK